MMTQHESRWTDHFDVVVPARRPDLVEHRLNEEIILYDPQNDFVHGLNETALEVWRQCDGARTTQQIAARQTERYQVDLATALDHVEQLVVCFAESNLLVPEDAHDRGA